jgi:hypothetical protein
MPYEITLEQLKMLAAPAGLKLSEEELQRLLPGVNRSRNQIADLREIVGLGDEPAGVFAAVKRAPN